MPRGGHRGGLFPVSGLPWGMNRIHLKRGLYSRKRTHIFIPRWGTRCSPGVASAAAARAAARAAAVSAPASSSTSSSSSSRVDSGGEAGSAAATATARGGGGGAGGGRRLLGGNTSPLPDGSTRVWEDAAHKAWPLKGGSSLHVEMYAQNEARFLLPAARCTAGPTVVEYILEQLEPSAAGRHRTYSGIGRPDVRLPHSQRQTDVLKRSSQGDSFIPLHLLEVYRSVMGGSSSSRVGSSGSSSVVAGRGGRGTPEGIGGVLQRGRIRRLWELICSSDTWRDRPEQRSSRAGGRGGGAAAAAAANAFPFVDEQAALVRELPLPEVLYARHTHRLQSRRHPFWVDMQYKKDKSKRPYIYRRRVAKQEAQTKEFGLSRAVGAF